MNNLQQSFRFFIVSTLKFDFLLSCVEKGCYGVSEPVFTNKVWPAFKDIAEGDRVFLRLADSVVCGPLIVSAPSPLIHSHSSQGLWRKVNSNTTAAELLPVWIEFFPWCFFFDSSLASQVNYSKLETLSTHHFNLPKWGILKPEVGSKLWEFIEAYGSSFSDFVQRISPTIRLRPPQQDTQRILSGRIKSKRGVLVRSKSERLIDDWLYDHNIRAEYERSLPLAGFVVSPDFYLPDFGIYIEHLGLLDSQEDYRRDWHWKKSLYDANNVKYITLTESDINDLDRNLSIKLRDYLK